MGKPNVEPNLNFEPPTTSSVATMNYLDAPYIRIIEQPARLQRFRYAKEKRFTPIKGVITVPAIEIVNYSKQVVVVVSCVTEDEPYRPHPNKVVGHNNNNRKFKDGICVITLKEPPFHASLHDFGIQWTKKADIEESLAERRKKEVDPFKTASLASPSTSYDLRKVRLCFQACINPTGEEWRSLSPIVTDTIIYYKNNLKLTITEISSYAAPAKGGDRMILLCENVEHKDIQVKFTEFDSQGYIKWQAYGDIKNVHKQAAISFLTPCYQPTDIAEPIKVQVQLERPSDKAVSEPVDFEFTPDPDFLKRKRMRMWIHRRLETNIQYPASSTTTPEFDGYQCSQWDMANTPGSQYSSSMSVQFSTPSPTLSYTNPFFPIATDNVNTFPVLTEVLPTEPSTSNHINNNHITQSYPQASTASSINQAKEAEYEEAIDSMTSDFASILSSDDGPSASDLMTNLHSDELVPIANSDISMRHKSFLS